MQMKIVRRKQSNHKNEYELTKTRIQQLELQ